MFELGNAKRNYLIDERTNNKYYADDYKIDLSDNNNTNVIIMNSVQEGSICLDVGCGSGYLGEILKNEKNAQVYGVDMDADALKVAKKRKCFEGLYEFSITERRGDGFSRFVDLDKKFDYIIFADVLEHTISAADVLLFFSKYLKPNGRLLVSLPNIAHFDIVRGLIDQKFNYNHIGLLDNTHLRFYTKSSFKELIEQINRVYKKHFTIKEIGKTVVKPGYIGDYPNTYALFGEDSCDFQYVYEIMIGEMKDNELTVEKKKFDILEKRLADLVDKREKLRKNDEEIRRLKERIFELEVSVGDIYNSTSWRVTRPIRGVSKVARHVAKSIDSKKRKHVKSRNIANFKKIADELKINKIKAIALMQGETITRERVKELVNDGCRSALISIDSGDMAPVLKEFGFRIVAIIDDLNVDDENIRKCGRNINFYADYLIFNDDRIKKSFEKEFDRVKAKTIIISSKITQENLEKVVKVFKEEEPWEMVDLSAVIPNYNYEDYLPMRIRSIIEQTMKPKEIILLDDKSSDDSIMVSKPLLMYAKEKYGIDYKIITNNKNKGCFSEWGKGCELAKYDYVWMAEADDYERPNFVETVLPSFNDKDVVISYCKSCKIDEESVVADYDFNWYIEDLDKTKWTRDFIDGGKEFIRRYLADRNSIPNASATIIRKSATKGIQEQLDKFQAIGDWYAYIYIISQGKVCYHAEVLNGFRRHEKSIIIRKEQSQLFLDEKDRILDYLNKYYL